ncbi:MAG: phosphopentomutase [Nitrospirae bacterium]|nr:phosphopentomutase [Nitrospirota bacterium]
MVKKVILITLDGLGIGELTDAKEFGDEGSNTLGNMATAVGGLKLPNLERMGLGLLGNFQGINKIKDPIASYGILAEASKAKDTSTGHWEMMGLIIERPFPLYPDGFPSEIIEVFEKAIGRKILGNKAASGTEIIKELGEEHMKTGRPIVYTSADSVFQIAAHEEVIPVEELYSICEIARDILKEPHNVGRVIARPFTGIPGNFKRTPRRKDYSLPPPGETVLDRLKEKNIPVVGIGKIEDIFVGKGISEAVHTENNQDGVEKTIEAMRKTDKGLILTNLVDFDMVYGHRNDPEGFAKALSDFDKNLPRFFQDMENGGILIITADHGCDPTTQRTDHSREYVPLLIYGKKIKAGINLGIRKTFADIGATISEIFDVGKTRAGEDFLKEITHL